jgi:DNA repair protein RadA/Sms
VQTQEPNPRRVVNGVDASRVAMLLAVLERRCGFRLSTSDVYVSTVGGIRLSEPGADLAIALAIASAVKDQALPATMAAVGEISLAGEIRPVAAAKVRAAEARRLGYTTIVDSEAGPLATAIRMAFASTSPGDRVDVPAV